MPELNPTVDEIVRALPAGIRSVRVIEILTVFWQGAAGTRHYSNQQWSDDFPLLASHGLAPVEARFERTQWFVDLPRTTEISDDVVQLKMWDANQTLIAAWLQSGEGTRCAITQYFPDFDYAIEIWWGFLRAPKETEGLYFNIEAASGLRSPNLVIPRRAIYPGCQATFGGLINPATNTPFFDTQAKIDQNECPYNRHIGGSFGTLDGSGQPWKSCPRQTPNDCTTRLGVTGPDGKPGFFSYLAFDVVIETTLVGSVYRGFYTSTHANDSVMRKPVRVVYGQRWIRDLILLAFLPESGNSSPNDGYLRTLWVVSEGPICGMPPVLASETSPPETAGPAPTPGQKFEFSGIVVNGQWGTVEHTNFASSWGCKRQSKTNFSDNVLNYSHTSVLHFNYGKGDFRQFTPDSLGSTLCQVKGLKKVRVYTTPTAYTEQYTNNRAWCLLDLYTNKRYGLGVDHSRFVIQDWLDLAAYCLAPVNSIDASGNLITIQRTVFNADIQEGKWSDHLTDICLAGYFTLPFYHQSSIRILPLEVPLASLGTIPVFSDQDDATASGLTRNIIFEGNRSTLKYSMKSDSEVPNEIKINYDDATMQNASRPLTLKDDAQQLRAGYAAGDETARPVTKEYNAQGVDSLSEAARLARRILDLGPFEQGGVRNNFKITFTTWSLLTDSLGLHPYSVIKVVSDTVNQFAEADGTPFEYFRIQKLTRMKNLQMKIEAQIFPRSYAASLEWKPAPGASNPGGGTNDPPEDTAVQILGTGKGFIDFQLNVMPRPTAPDTAPPVISSGPTASVTSTGVTITWTTDELSDSQVDYGLTP
jgi:hypothetical protein